MLLNVLNNCDTKHASFNKHLPVTNLQLRSHLQKSLMFYLIRTVWACQFAYWLTSASSWQHKQLLNIASARKACTVGMTRWSFHDAFVSTQVVCHCVVCWYILHVSSGIALQFACILQVLPFPASFKGYTDQKRAQHCYIQKHTVSGLIKWNKIWSNKISYISLYKSYGLSLTVYNIVRFYHPNTNSILKKNSIQWFLMCQ